jgi:hypothetical protein
VAFGLFSGIGLGTVAAISAPNGQDHMSACRVAKARERTRL